jgi:hypothetical protein
MVFTDWASGDIAIRDISTGQVKRLMAKTGTFQNSNEAYAESPFSRQICADRIFLERHQEGDRQLRVMQNEPEVNRGS